MMTENIVTADTVADPTITVFPSWMPLLLRTEIKQYLACEKSIAILEEQQALNEGGDGYRKFLQDRIQQARDYMGMMEERYD